ncbi:uncharacterized protein LOC131992897 [Centropristis striata]|uniref:uncharacterized protein LOC131992897 n=1 Tax=Centropristis striata TaxID=184440 RepID=UPI0027DFE9E9|nr:uncharacterized protein LOC131992897 [Centropristis striata]
MSESEAVASEQDAVVTLEEKPSEETEETCVRVFYTTRENNNNNKQAAESDSALQPLLQHQHPENHTAADTHTQTDGAADGAADGADGAPSAPPELQESAACCRGSTRSLCSSSSRAECPICSELFQSDGDHRVLLLNCDHALCHRCTAAILRRARDRSRLQCPFCRQTTPLPRWEVRRLQEESYTNSVYDAAPPPPLLLFTPAPPELQEVPAPLWRTCVPCSREPSCVLRGLRLMRPHSLCLSIAALLLLLLLLLGCFLYMVVPLIMLSILFSSG